MSDDRLGLIEQEVGGRYDPGPAALRVGLASLPLGEALSAKAWRERMSDLEGIVDEARRHLVSRGVGSLIPGVNAFSPPVFDLDHNPALVITVTDHEDRLPVDWQGAGAAAVVRAARELSQRLGGHARASTHGDGS